MTASKATTVHTEWAARPERGSACLLHMLMWVTLRLGRPIGRLFLYPICGYFLLFSGEARRASRRYLERVLARPPKIRDLFRHYHAFAATTHDRVYLLAGRHRYFDLQVQGAALFERLDQRKQGCILLGAHLGSFEVMRAFGLYDRQLPITVLMHQGATPNLNRALHSLRPDLPSRIISMGTPEAALDVKARLNRGELIGILGDRIVSGEKTVPCRFFGEDILFPEGPLMLASLVGAPVILFFGLYRGGRRYDIHFELLAERIVLDRSRRSDHLQSWMQRYVDRLEHYCRLAPENWFNFYDLPRAEGRPRPDSRSRHDVRRDMRSRR